MPRITQSRRDPALEALGEVIRTTRLAQSVSQEALALMAGVDRSYVGRIERGDNNVAVLTLLKLAAALGLSASALLRRAGL